MLVPTEFVRRNGGFIEAAFEDWDVKASSSKTPGLLQPGDPAHSSSHGFESRFFVVVWIKVDLKRHFRNKKYKSNNYVEASKMSIKSFRVFKRFVLNSFIFGFNIQPLVIL